MMEKELVVEIFEKAKKAADAAAAEDGWSPEEERCLDALKQLKQLPITRDIIFSTQIGKRLWQLNNHPRKRIQALSSNLMDTLKRSLLLEEFFKKGKKNGDGGGVKVGGQTETEGASKCEKSMSDSKKHGKQRLVLRLKPKLGPVPVGTRRLTSLQKTNDKSRDKIREILAESLRKVDNEVNDQNLREAIGACDPCGVAATVETELFKTWGSYDGPNKVKYRSVMFNIKDDKNPDFRRKVLLGLFPADIILTLTAEDMASDARRLENQKIREKAVH